MVYVFYFDNSFFTIFLDIEFHREKVEFHRENIPVFHNPKPTYMSKKYVFISLVLLVSTNTFCQDTISISTQFKKFDNYSKKIKIDRVIDARSDISNVGILMDTLTDKATFLNFQKPLCDTFKEFFDFCAVTTNGKSLPLILKINYLELNERKIFLDEESKKPTMLYWIYCDYELVYKVNDSTYTSLYQRQEALEGKITLVNSQNYNQLLWEFWNKQIKDWDFVLKLNKENFQKVSLSSISKLPEILNFTQPKKGVFNSFGDFVTNSPIDSTSQCRFKPNDETGFQVESITDKSLKWKKDKTRWGLSDGMNVFYNFETDYADTRLGIYVPIQPLGTTFEVAGQVMNPTLNYPNSKRLGHLSGNLVANSIITNFNPSTFNTAIVAISVAQLLFSALKEDMSSFQRYNFDMVTGKIQKIPIINLTLN